MSAAVAPEANPVLPTPEPAMIVPEPLPGLLSFHLPAELEASVPPEARGITRDAVRMMVAYGDGHRLIHTTFSELPRFLRAGDLVVVNTSGTLAAEVPARTAAGLAIDVHLSTETVDGAWAVELRRGDELWSSAVAGDELTLPAAGSLRLVGPMATGSDGIRLWRAHLDLPDPLLRYLAVHGRPIAYRYVNGRWPLSAYQNVYATEPGSAEMPSAGRPFTPEVITRLVAAGIGVAPVLLHTGVASLEASEPPYPERFRVSSSTAQRVNDTRRHRGRVVPIGTTVVRALESAADPDGHLTPVEGFTETIITPERGVFAVDGLLTGWHEPEASHLAMLEAVAGRPLLEASYRAALAEGYLWHEFGDVHLILP